MKAFLFEMMVVREDIEYPLKPHSFHGDAIGETLVFVRTRLVQDQACEKARTALRNHPHIATGEHVPHD